MSLSLLKPKKLLTILQGFIKETEELLDRKMKGELPHIRVQDSTPDFEQPDLGMRSGEKEIIIPKGEEYLVRGLLALEAFRRFLPASISELPQAIDLAWSFAYSQMGKAERRKWKVIWRKVAKTIDLGDIIHQPVEAFTLLEEMKPQQGLAELVGIFYEIDRYHEKVDTKEFIHIVEDFFTHYQVKLSEREVKVLEAVAREPEFDLEELAEKIRINPRKVSSTIASLKRRGILFLRESVAFSRLGFSTYNLYLVPRRTLEEKALEILRRYPYLYSLTELIDGLGGYIATLVLPFWLDIEKEMQRIRGLLEQLCQPNRFLCFKRTRSYRHRNFRHYSLSDNDWRIPWQSWTLWLKRILEHSELSSVSEVMTKLNSRRTEKPAALDEIDWAILKEVWDGESRARQLRQKLGIGSLQLQERMQRLREKGVIMTSVGVLCVGLSEPVFLLIHGNPKKLWSLIAAFDELPFHVTVEAEGDINGLFSVLTLPRGQGTAFAHQIHKHIKENQIQLHLGRRIPLSYFEFPLPP